MQGVGLVVQVGFREQSLFSLAAVGALAAAGVVTVSWGVALADAVRMAIMARRWTVSWLWA